MNELKNGDRVVVLLDPLSHGSNMQSLRIEVEVLRVESATESFESEEFEAEFELDIAVAKVVMQQVTDWGDASSPLATEKIDDTWGNLVGEILVWHRVNGAGWIDTCTQQEVDFVVK